MQKYLRTFTTFFTILYLFSSSLAPTLAAVSYLYDANGNMTSNGTDCFEYNEANQLKKVKKCATNEIIAEYVYDYKGNRIVKKVYTNGTLQKTAYSPTDDYETVKIASNSAVQNTSYYFANNQVIAKKDHTGKLTYFHNDHLGSTQVITDTSGNLVENTSYDPWGEIAQGGTQSKFLYTGQENDPETNLHYYNARYYDPHIRRFTQPDDIIQNIYDPQSLNRYSYVRNNPLKHTDPSGNIGITNVLIGSFVAIVASFAAFATVMTNPFFQLPSTTYTYPNTNISQHISQRTLSKDTNANQGIDMAVSINKSKSTSRQSWEAQTLQENKKSVSTIKHLPPAIKVAYFGYMVRPGGPWDYKKNDGAKENFGNFNYGYIGRELGITPYGLQNMAGLAQQIDNLGTKHIDHETPPVTSGIPFWSYPNGDSVEGETAIPTDQIFIESGIALHDFE